MRSETEFAQRRAAAQTARDLAGVEYERALAAIAKLSRASPERGEAACAELAAAIRRVTDSL